MTASHCVLVSNRSELKSCTDTALTSFCTTKHECRRKILLHGLGSEEERATPAQRCCDICTGGTIPFLDICKPTPVKRNPKPKAVRSVSQEVAEDVKNRLLAERQKILRANIGLRTIGGAVVCPQAYLDEICKILEYIVSPVDISKKTHVREIFAQRFYSVIMNTLKYHGL